MSVAAVVPAAGSGTRLGAGAPKAFVPLAGVPIVVRAVDGLLASGVVDEVLVAVPAPLVDQAEELLAGRPVRVLVGGAERTATVRRALESLEARAAHGGERAATPEGHADIVLVHDAARPLTPPALIASVVEAVRAGHPAVVPVLPLADTVKQVVGSHVESTVDRSRLRAVQTPQGFTVDTLRAAYAQSGVDAVATDDAGLVERVGGTVHTVPGDPAAFKVTTAWDLRIAELLLEGS
ncbi:2-C-methyl-D-erythritol 4-phosphate cytidylyltransferase [Pseudonocardia sp. WMMC193]|uniref:2-C-methyl-D-erythritol 4-phosphate cytidylyltransferase n=1 Tax=Pseudonocardia sp. WMMC193 TaxID=2911965 RepID=UPI001F00776A|nr:2-C-methyl-D-erythritol 4-phosphate cytidylyltransferase [Pseudonocardia sp. WMMC193]MCF7552543.1 2-C-methyl-D-erythritol 4-phosphate cytidylyltransferase [Pseudonocardia sp. WMMC193]